MVEFFMQPTMTRHRTSTVRYTTGEIGRVRGDRRFFARVRRPRAARGHREGVAVAPKPRFVQARNQKAPRALSAHDSPLVDTYTEWPAGGKGKA